MPHSPSADASATPAVAHQSTSAHRTEAGSHPDGDAAAPAAVPPADGHPPFAPLYGHLLLQLARRAIARELHGDIGASIDVPIALRNPGATFVTLSENGALRGCIGSLEAWRPIKDDVEANARAAAFHDPRFDPLRAEELDRVHIEVSVLSHPQPLDVQNEAQAATRLRPGIDGAILETPRHRGTFLPQVWEQVPDPGEFIRHLKRKAGLDPDAAWQPDWRLARYTVTAFSE